MKDCANCKHCELFKGAYTGTVYCECGLKRKNAENLTEEELLYIIQHPEKQPCDFKNGKPEYKGITYDD